MIKPYILGTIYLLILTVLAIYLNQLTNNIIGEVVVALLLGIAAANTLSIPKDWGKMITFGEKRVLGWAIALMGLQLSFIEVKNLAWLLPVIVILIIASLYLGEKIAAKFGVQDKCGILIGAGNAICGSAAIAAISPVIKSEPHQTGVAISVIQILGTIGMLLIPVAATIIPASDTFWGVVSGGSLQAVGQAIAGGFAISESAGETASIIKMSRVLMLLPVVLYFSFRFRDKSDAGKKLKFPVFILAFVILMVIANVFLIPNEVMHYANNSQDFLLTFAMVAIGNKIHYKDLMVKGLNAIKLGTFLFTIQVLFLILVLVLKNIIVG